MQQVKWGESSRLLLRVASNFSKELGHQEIICVDHLFLALLINVRPLTLTIPAPEWSVVRKVWADVHPPFEEGVKVLSPGGQTPFVKQVITRAAELAVAAGEPCEAEHFWSALWEQEGERLTPLLARLRMGGSEM